MLDTINKALKTPFGIKLMSPASLGKLSGNTAADEYFEGDRENGGIFKHACMMAVVAMFKAAKTVQSKELANRLAEIAYWMIDLTLPYKTMENPFVLCGNPRFCTQYNNSETGENIGPMLSGTASWLTLALFSALGVEFYYGKLHIDPILRMNQTNMKYELCISNRKIQVTFMKQEGLCRIENGKFELYVDGEKANTNTIDISEVNSEIELIF
jgi:cellobiose phosphorylase